MCKNTNRHQKLRISPRNRPCALGNTFQCSRERHGDTAAVVLVGRRVAGGTVHHHRRGVVRGVGGGDSGIRSARSALPSCGPKNPKQPTAAKAGSLIRGCSTKTDDQDRLKRKFLSSPSNVRQRSTNPPFFRQLVGGHFGRSETRTSKHASGQENARIRSWHREAHYHPTSAILSGKATQHFNK